MRLLILTQKVDRQDSVLGFFHKWLEEFAERFERLTVICLEKGSFSLPENVKVLSLGKEDDAMIYHSVILKKFLYIIRFHKYIWQERENYDAVFVHMNQEYVILAGDLWRLLGKKIYLWRNHKEGNFLTRYAVWLSDKVFYTSSSSFTAKFKKAVKMPVGVDTNFFKPDPSVERIPNSILFLGRISPVKKVLEFVEWFETLDQKFTATVAGEALPRDRAYEELVKKKASPRIKFIGPVTQEEALKLYQTHEIYVNKTPAGSFDKTIVEAAACGMKLMVDNPDAKDLNPEEHSLNKLMEKLTLELS